MKRDSMAKYFLAAAPIVAVTLGCLYYVAQTKPSGKIAVVDSKHGAKHEGEPNEDQSPARKERVASLAKPKHPAPTGEYVYGAEAASDHTCNIYEIRGAGPAQTPPTKVQWALAMKIFHDLKDEFKIWLEKHQSSIAPNVAEVMERQIVEMRIQRPPVMEEQDLTWRGIGVWSQGSGDDAALLKLGNGFVQLISKSPARARFELARLMAQSWAPCELERVGAGKPWSALLSCLNVSEDQSASCAANSYSEGGWAVSTALAASIAPPGCVVPAARVPSVAECFKNIPFSRDSKHAFEEIPIRTRLAHPVRAQGGRL